MLLGASQNAHALKIWEVQNIGAGVPGPGGPGMKATISVVLADPTLAAGDIILVHESAYSVAVAAGIQPPIPGLDPLLTIYVEDLTFPPIDVTVKVDLINPGIGNVVRIEGTGTSSVVRFMSPANTRGSVLDGFTIRGGTGSEDPWLNDTTLMVGGGILCSGATPTITNCIVSGNTATLGGGLYASPGSYSGNFLSGPLVQNCEFSSNQAILGIYSPTVNSVFDVAGGGICAVHCSPEIRDVIVRRNSSEVNGGGIAFMNPPGEDFGVLPVVSPILDKTDILDNRTDTDGGGVYIWISEHPLISECRIKFNTAGGKGQGSGEGGGFYWDNSFVEMTKCHIVGNRADAQGGGILFEGEGDIAAEGAPPIGGSLITHCTIERNSTTDQGFTLGGGVRGRLANDNPSVTTTFENCLIVNNSADAGGGLALEFSRVAFQNCTVSQNTAHGTGSVGYAGGILFDQSGNSNATLGIQDCIIDGNLSTSMSPPKIWEVDLADISFGLQSPVTIGYSVMSKAAAYPPFAAGSGNIATAPLFAVGPAWKYFPNGSFYLAHSPEQNNTSVGYGVGSQQIGNQLAVYNMTCRTAFNFLDTGIVDIGFHYPGLVGLP